MKETNEQFVTEKCMPSLSLENIKKIIIITKTLDMYNVMKMNFSSKTNVMRIPKKNCGIQIIVRNKTF